MRIFIKTINTMNPAMIIGFVLLTLNVSAMAVNTPSILSLDNRIRQVAYDPNDVVPIIGKTFVTSEVVFGDDEVIQSVQSGDMIAWTVSIPKATPNVLFLKPTKTNSNTNMTVMTNKHTYFFNLHATQNKKTKATYALEFRYPKEIIARHSRAARLKRLRHGAVISGARSPVHYNWQYSFNGDTRVMPVHVFDDGVFTYMQLQPHQPIPAVFAVQSVSGKEAVVNYRLQGKYLVIQTVAPQFTLRDGSTIVASIFNDKLIHRLTGRHSG